MEIPIDKIAQNCNVLENQVLEVMSLLGNGSTVPFIARYRKEVTGGLNEVLLEKIDINILKYNNIKKRKLSIINQLKENESVHDSVFNTLRMSWDLNEIEDAFLPFKKTRKSKVDLAFKAGLGGLAKQIYNQKQSISKTQINSYKCDIYITNEEIIGGIDY